MFKCQRCGAQSKKGDKPVRVVTKTRYRQYENGTFGNEIVQEKVVCSVCARILNQK